MARQVVLLRGINIGPRNRIAMPALREALTVAGYEDVGTYVQSGNVVLSTQQKPERVQRECAQLIADAFGLEIAVVVRTREELASVVERDPLGDLVTEPKRYQVSFLSEELAPGLAEMIAEKAGPSERVVIDGREIYAWHPGGVGPSKLWAFLASKSLRVTATARNWTTVTTLLGMADE